MYNLFMRIKVLHEKQLENIAIQKHFAGWRMNKSK